MDHRVRTIGAGDIDSWAQCMGVGFLYTVAEGYPQYLLGDVDLERTWGAFDGGRVVGTLRSFATAFTVPGPATVGAAALTNVTVAPDHRRRGLLTEMITADLRASAGRGEPVGILIASEYPIYGRFGYGAAVEGAAYSVDLASTRFRRRGGGGGHQAGNGTVELVDLPTLRREAPALYERFRVAQPGSIERSARWWDRVLHQVEVPGANPPKGYRALYRSPQGVPEGYVRYGANQGWDSMRQTGELTVEELVATTPAAYERLWRYCCEVDLVTTVRAGDRPVDEALPWLLEDGRTVRQTGRFDFLWVRVLDVVAALSARRYAVEGRLVVDVVDPLGFAGGRYALEGGPSGAACARTEQAPDLTMPVEALGSMYLGGVSARILRDTGYIDEDTSGAIDRADVMFRSSTAPWCSTWF
ncbi:MAG TPA: GNAT family N-acetyltransferase [Acidimicrobiales bacterium]|nr:GNAT family N-acetyltransferase [Acidimicrobiales bacterium]